MTRLTDDQHARALKAADAIAPRFRELSEEQRTVLLQKIVAVVLTYDVFLAKRSSAGA